MIQWLREKLGLCSHKWTIIRTVGVYDKINDRLPYAYEYILQCQHCGNIKNKRIVGRQ